MARNELPPFPFTVDRFVEEVKSEAASMASQACAAFATLATKAVVPGEFRGAVPAVVALVEREGEGFDVAAKESALAALVALLACVEGAAEDAVGLGVVGKLVAAAAARDDGRLDVNAIEALRVLVTVEAAASAVVADESLINAVVEFVAERAVRPAPNPGAPDDVAEASLDLLCGLASKRSDGGACRDAVIRGGGVTVLARVLANARNDEVVIRALLASGDDHREGGTAGGVGSRGGRGGGAHARHAFPGRRRRRRREGSRQSPRKKPGAQIADGGRAQGEHVGGGGGGDGHGVSVWVDSPLN